MDGMSPLLTVENLSKRFPIRSGLSRRAAGFVRAVDDVSFELRRRETLALVGESGCGKTTVSRCVVGAYRPTEGRILFALERGDQVDISQLGRRELREVRREIQMIFQDPSSSLNPRMTLLEIVGEPLLVHGERNPEVRRERVAELLEMVGLRPEYMNRYPHAFSGGQRQRIGIARALALNPTLLVADEAVSALDVSVQAQVLNLLLDLQDDLGLGCLFVAHDLSVVRHVSDRVAVMYVGRLVEIGHTADVYYRPLHPYTDALISSVPVPDPRKPSMRVRLEGEVADAAAPPSGCHFHPRCPYATEICVEQKPLLTEVSPGRWVGCHHATDLDLKGIAG